MNLQRYKIIGCMFAALLLVGHMHAQDSCPRLPMCVCSDENTEVRCQHNVNVTHIPAHPPSTAEYLYLDNNSIVGVDTHAFATLTNLIQLRLSWNSIHTIDQYAFSQLSNLQLLCLSHNNITEIKRYTFSGMKALETLHVTFNSIRSIDENAFDELSNLKILLLTGNPLTVIPAIGHMPFLRRFDLSHSNIHNATFPSSFFKSSNIEEISLRSNKIRDVDHKMFDALANASFVSVDMSVNPICFGVTSCAFTNFEGIFKVKLGGHFVKGFTLKNIIRNLANIRLISVEVTKMYVSLEPNTFTSMYNTSLDTVNISDCTMSGLTQSPFVGLNKLKTLLLEDCSMRTLDQYAFDGLDELKELSLAKNNLDVVPKILPRTLEKLNMNWNDIEYTHIRCEQSVCGIMDHITELDLSHNRIYYWSQKTFRGIKRLEKLDLSSNNIRGYSRYHMLFDPLVNITWLSLANNKIRKLYSNKFISPTLRYLDLSNNSMSDLLLEPDGFEGLPSLQVLHLERNELGVAVAEHSDRLFIGLHNLKELYLTSNRIKSMADSLFQQLHSLELLKLDDNAIVQFNGNAFKPTQNLLRLDLHNNSISNIKAQDLDMLPSTLQWVNLTGNPFFCDCDLLSLRYWVNRSRTIAADYASYICVAPEQWCGRPLLSYTQTRFECMLIQWWPMILGFLLGTLLVVVVGSVLYKKRWWIRLFIYKMSMKRNENLVDNMVEEDEDGPCFDAYVSCAKEDYVWVKKHLLPGIDVEGGGDFRLYYEGRDAIAGQTDIGNISENLATSRKVIVIISRHYNNAMNRFELDLATQRMYDGKIQEIVIIHRQQGLPEDMLHRHIIHKMQRNKVLEWADDAHAQELVKQEIIKSLSDTHTRASDRIVN